MLHVFSVNLFVSSKHYTKIKIYSQPYTFRLSSKKRRFCEIVGFLEFLCGLKTGSDKFVLWANNRPPGKICSEPAIYISVSYLHKKYTRNCIRELGQDTDNFFDYARSANENCPTVLPSVLSLQFPLTFRYFYMVTPTFTPVFFRLVEYTWSLLHDIWSS